MNQNAQGLPIAGRLKKGVTHSRKAALRCRGYVVARPPSRLDIAATVLAAVAGATLINSQPEAVVVRPDGLARFLLSGAHVRMCR